jgi:hypothetical protein
MLDYVKQVKDWTTIACYVYNNKYYKVFSIAFYYMRLEDFVA